MLKYKPLYVLCLSGILLACQPEAPQAEATEPTPQAQARFEPTWESLASAEVPEWLKDAKFGVYTHWGLYSFPEFGINTYGADMYLSPQSDAKRHGIRAHHEKTYGPIEEFGYKDFLPMFTAPAFNADEWVAIMEDAGARYAGIHLVHHDGYCLWDSEYTAFDSMDTGPKRDIFGEIAGAVRKTDMKLLATFHHARTYGFGFQEADQYSPEQRAKLDIFDPELDYIYRNPETVSIEEFSNEWHNKINEVIDKYQPDLLWFDGLAKGKKAGIIKDDKLLKTFADFYNNGTDYTDQPFIFNKLPASLKWNFPIGVGLRTYENARDMEQDVRGDWNIDRAIAYPWNYVVGKEYPHDHHYHITSLIDIVARGGSFLLSLTPRGDGSIPSEEKAIMAGMGQWLRVNGEAIYDTRPWKIAGEGIGAEEMYNTSTKVTGSGKKRIMASWDYNLLTESKGEAIRFTRNGNTLYAIVLGRPVSSEVSIQTLHKGNVEQNGAGIKSVRLVGSDKDISWTQSDSGLTIQFPEQLPSDIAHSFKIEVHGTLDASAPAIIDDGIPRLGDWPIYKTPI
ncbi:MAG: alpha-L-fucosidase [Pseudomonadales bacterium]